MTQRDSHARRTRLRSGAALGGLALALALAVAAAGTALAERRDSRTTVAIWRTTGGAVGGYGYGGVAAADGAGGAFVSHRRDVDIAADGVLRFPGVAAALDAATVELRSVTDPAGTSIVEQRFDANRASPEALLARQVGKPVTIVLAQGEVRGTLRAVALDALVVETPVGLEIVRRGEHVVDIKLGAAVFDHEPTLEWRLAARRPGRHTVEVAYRTQGLSWQPEYGAVLGDADAVDFTAWATVRNDSGLDLVAGELALVTAPPAAPGATGLVGAAAPAATSFKVARAIDLPSGEVMQVELTPRRTAVKARRLNVFEAAGDQSAGYPLQDCYGQGGGAAARAEQVLELDGPGQVLPEGTLRVFRRTGTGLTVVSDDVLRVNATTGALRLRGGPAPELGGERRQLECRLDPSGRALREKLEVRVENHGKAAAEVVVREYLYRWTNWRIDQEDVKGVRAGPTAQEWRVRVPAGGSKTLTYTVDYAW